MTTHEHTKHPYEGSIEVEQLPTVDLTELDQVENPDDILEILAEPLDLTDEQVANDPETRTLIQRIQAHPWVVRASLIGGATIAAVQPAAADTVNWTDIGTMLTGLADIMPSVSTLVMAVVPVLITLLIVGFITGLLDGIIDAIRAGTKLFK
jgi:hypothetical protein